MRFNLSSLLLVAIVASSCVSPASGQGGEETSADRVAEYLERHPEAPIVDPEPSSASIITIAPAAMDSAGEVIATFVTVVGPSFVEHEEYCIYEVGSEAPEVSNFCSGKSIFKLGDLVVVSEQEGSSVLVSDGWTAPKR